MPRVHPTLERLTSSDVHYVTPYSGPCRTLVNMWEDPANPGVLSLRIKTQITDLEVFQKYKKGESAFEDYSSTCRYSEALRRSSKELWPSNDCSILRQNLKEQAKWLRELARKSSYTNLRVASCFAVCIAQYWENSGPTLCEVDTDCHGNHHFGDARLKLLKGATGTLLMDWIGSEHAGHLIMTAQALWTSEEFDPVREGVLKEVVARYRRLTEVGAATSLREGKTGAHFSSACQMLVDTAEKYRKYHPFVEDCKIVTKRDSPAIAPQDSELTAACSAGSRPDTTQGGPPPPDLYTAQGSSSSRAIPAELPQRPPGMNSPDGAGLFRQLRKRL